VWVRVVSVVLRQLKNIKTTTLKNIKTTTKKNLLHSTRPAAEGKSRRSWSLMSGEIARRKREAAATRVMSGGLARGRLAEERKDLRKEHSLDSPSLATC
jgi:hypothetical protein